MIDIRIPKEIRTYKEKIYFGLNLRQLICAGMALGINIPLYWFGRNVVGDEVVSYIVIVTAVPFAAIGFIKYNGMNFEQLLIAIFKFNFLTQQKRKYKVKNICEIIDEYIIEEEIKSINNSKKKFKGKLNTIEE